ncbi:RNA polymerase II C-terminal domain phosphatase 2-like protein [Trifolium pratense]|uniref:RNA polymerase II C-terminal domain phosphatase 2-like protein n=2 Tax=Trifolium pratense TaxID=57577 RepID=A0A2K3PFN2_TRIPR|nr:RNA polymerase II C-terminal domain phosphatase 2-like protein [Trifolium pratense]
MEPLCKAVNRELDDLSLEHENGFLWDEVNPESSELQTEDGLQRESASEASDAETRPLKSNPVNQQNEKRSFPRTPQPVSSKRLKE